MATPANDALNAALADQPIRLTFELGEITMPAGELADLDAGYLFSLRASPTRPVAIKANGAPFGVGELVEVDGRLAVRLLEADGDGP